LLKGALGESLLHLGAPVDDHAAEDTATQVNACRQAFGEALRDGGLARRHHAGE
jgi:hypothetical protein